MAGLLEDVVPRRRVGALAWWRCGGLGLLAAGKAFEDVREGDHRG